MKTSTTYAISYKAGLSILSVKDHKGSEIDAVKIVKN
jgi:hypothetical protein